MGSATGDPPRLAPRGRRFEQTANPAALKAAEMLNMESPILPISSDAAAMGATAIIYAHLACCATEARLVGEPQVCPPARRESRPHTSTRASRLPSPARGPL